MSVPGAGPAAGREREGAEVPDRVDVAVVGAGLAGACTALHLARSGLSVALLERYRAGRGASHAAVGVLSPPVREPFHHTVRFRGEEAAREVWEFAARSVRGLADLLEERDAVEATELDLSGGHVLAESHSDHVLHGSFEALERAGLPVRWLDRTDVSQLVGGRGFTGGYRIDGSGALNPTTTAEEVLAAAVEAGATLVEDVEVRAVRRDGDGLVCETDEGRVSCSGVVHATHVEAGRALADRGVEIIPVRGQAWSTAPVERRFHGGFATHWKMNVWRQAPSGELRVGGWRHDAWDRSYQRSRPDVDAVLQRDLREWFRAAFPDLAPLSVRREWSGVFGWTPDWLPVVGAVPHRPGEWVIAGFGGGGLPFVFEAGRQVARLLLDEESVSGGRWFDPARFDGGGGT